jgi:DNA polymerase-3 subunit gamma/tau
VAEAPPGPGDAGAGQPAPGAGIEDWAELVPALPLAGFARELAAHSVVQKMDGDRLALALDPEHGHLLNESRRRQLEEALVTHLGRPVHVAMELAASRVETPAARQARREADRRRAAESAIANDPTVRQLQDTFGASILPDSVRPAD